MTDNPMSTTPDDAASTTARLIRDLQEVTETLAGTRTAAQVFEVILKPALVALQAIAGTVLLVTPDGVGLSVAAVVEQAALIGQPSIWQDSPLTDTTPATDALRQHEARYFEHSGELTGAYPDLEARAGAQAAVASAVLPMFLDGRPLGVIVLDFKEPHTFTPEEQHFLRTLAAQCAIALGRVQLVGSLEEQIQARTAALDAFVQFTEAAGNETDVLRLARTAMEMFNQLFPGCTSGLYQMEHDQWVVQVHTEDLHAETRLLASLRAGLPLDTPVFAQSQQTGEPVFVDVWDAAVQRIEQTNAYQTVATYPLTVNSTVHAIYALGLKDAAPWTEQGKAVFRAVGRSLTLALERSEVTRTVQEQNAELEARTLALEGIAQFSRDLALDGERDALIRRAAELVLSLLPHGFAAFHEAVGGRWHVAVQVGAVGSAPLQRQADQGFMVGQTPTLDHPARTRAPWFQDEYDHSLDVDPMLAAHLHTVASLPVIVNETVIGIFTVALFTPRRWHAADRALLTTTVRNLGLVLEGAQGVAQLAEERRKLVAANEELEAFAFSVSHDLRTPVRHIVGFNAMLRRSLDGRANAKETRYLVVIDEAAQRMNDLIDDMLNLSRTSRQPLHLGRVDLAALVTVIRAELAPEVGDRGVTWTIGALPEVMADAGLLRQVVQNLLHNALKFSRPREQAVIAVWGEERETEWAVSVQDNGAGFEPAYQHKLFGVFQRLHHQDEFEGTGVGLATVRRIIVRHGGTIAAVGQLGQGATFTFTLPRPL